MVLVVIGALAYFGVLTPETFLPEKCTFPIQLGCPDYRIYYNPQRNNDPEMTLVLSNGAGRDMTITQIGAYGPGSVGCYLFTPFTVRNGQQASVNLTRNVANSGNCPAWLNTGRSKNKYTINVTYNWVDSPGISHTLQGELLAKTE